MSDNECCNEHKAVIIRLKRNEDDIQSIWKEINNMKKWVISGMTGLLIQVVVFIFALVLVLFGKIG